MKSGPSRRGYGFFVLALLALGFVIYSHTFHSPFQFDDEHTLLENLAMRHIHSLAPIWRYWPTRFLTFLSFVGDYRLHRLDVVGYHVFNLAVHLGAGLLVWWLGLLTFATPALKDGKAARQAPLISFFAALVFVAHPLQTEGVTYIIQRAVSLAAFFYLASLALYARSRLLEAGRGPAGAGLLCRGGSLAAAVAAMFCKEMSITLPLAVCLYEFSFFRDRNSWRRVVVYMPLLLVIPLTMGMTRSVDFLQMRRVSEAPPGIAPFTYLLTQLRVIVTYLRLLVLPVHQNLDYDYPLAHSLADPAVLASLLLIAGLLALAVFSFRNHRLIAFSIFFFFLALAPESSILPIRDVIFEHRLYLSMAAFGFFLASVLYRFVGSKSRRWMAVIGCVLLACYSVLTFHRNTVWADRLTLWDDTVKKSPRKARPRFNRGYVHQDRGELDLAIADYGKAIELDPDYAQAYNTRGTAYGDKGALDLALADFNKALSLNPRDHEAYVNRAAVNSEKGLTDLALADLRKAEEIKPDYVRIYHNRGLIYKQRGDFDKALAEFDKAIALKPDFVEAYLNRGNLYGARRQFDRALADFDTALALDAGCAPAYVQRAMVYAVLGDYARSRADLRRAQALGVAPDPRVMKELEELAAGRK
ncbi:MAG: tetratricopeptide repeat protein [Deltaproteobacteria bacterium]